MTEGVSILTRRSHVINAAVLMAIMLAMCFAASYLRVLSLASGTTTRHSYQLGRATFRWFEQRQQNNSVCFGPGVQPAATWIPTLLCQKNVFFVWMGPAPIPDRVAFAIASAALVYGSQWTVHVVTSHSSDDLLQRVTALLHNCVAPAMVEHRLIDVVSVVRGLSWPEDKVELVKAMIQGSKTDVVTISDIVRAFIVYVNGGVYLDSDTIVLHRVIRPTLGVRCIGQEMCYKDEHGLRISRGFFPSCPITCMANGIFALPRGHPLMERYLKAMSQHLATGKWGVIGPRLLLDVIDTTNDQAPYILDDVYAMDTKCLICWDHDRLEDCTNYTYLAFGNADGELPPLARAAFEQTMSRHCVPQTF